MMEFRNATKKDFAQVIHLGRIPEFTTPVDKKYLRRFLANGVFLVAQVKGEIVGFALAEPMLGEFMWLDAITVRKDKRGKGIGKLLMVKMKEELKKRKVKEIYLMAPKFNKKTIKFYESLGMNKGKEFIEFTKKLN